MLRSIDVLYIKCVASPVQNIKWVGPENYTQQPYHDQQSCVTLTSDKNKMKTKTVTNILNTINSFQQITLNKDYKLHHAGVLT